MQHKRTKGEVYQQKTKINKKLPCAIKEVMIFRLFDDKRQVPIRMGIMYAIIAIKKEENR